MLYCSALLAFCSVWRVSGATWAVPMPDPRWFVYALWGIGSVVVWALVVSDAYGQWQLRRDQRSKRELLAATGLFFTALGAAASIALVLFGEPGSTPRTFALAFALGMFPGAGIVILTMRKGEEP